MKRYFRNWKKILKLNHTQIHQNQININKREEKSELKSNTFPSSNIHQLRNQIPLTHIDAKNNKGWGQRAYKNRGIL
jgi:hypothetical protein